MNSRKIIESGNEYKFMCILIIILGLPKLPPIQNTLT